jgi:hypothetical protein
LFIWLCLICSLVVGWSVVCLFVCLFWSGWLIASLVVGCRFDLLWLRRRQWFPEPVIAPGFAIKSDEWEGPSRHPWPASRLG